MIASSLRTARLVCLVLLLSGAPSFGAALRDGDIIFHTSRSGQSAAIQRATRSPYSHVGVVFFRDGKPFVFEAIATVRYTPLATWIGRGNGSHYVVRRLKSGLTAAQIDLLKRAARRFESRPYDLYFEWSDTTIYCSELVWKLYKRALSLELGTRQKLRDFSLDDAVVRAKLRERYGSRIPLDEPVISPAAIHDSPLLETVASQ